MAEENKKEPQLVDQIIKQIQSQNPPKKQIPLKKEAKSEKTPPIKEKHYYDVRVECMLPATITYRVLAEDAQQASDLIKNMPPTGVKHRLLGKKDIKISVYDAGTTMLRWIKNLIG